MERDELREAGEILEQAADDCEDAALGERIRGQAERIAGLAERSRGPDHGRLARHMHALQNIADEAGQDDVAARVEEALEAVRSYRETVSGV